MLRRTALITLAGSVLAACAPEQSKPQFKAVDITGAEYAKDFALPDTDGKLRTIKDFAGKAVVVFFGYTQCPDVCPTTLGALGEAMKQLGPDGDRVQVLFVTLDPERDTPELLAKYVPSFDARFLGLLGNADEIERTAKEFRVRFQKQPGTTRATYTIDHSLGTYIFDAQGRLRINARLAQGPDEFVRDLRAVLKS